MLATLVAPLNLSKSVANLASFRPRVKLATLGGDMEKPFEQAFASIGYGYIKDRAPQLVDAIRGFQLIDRDDENSKAVGVFVFQLGDLWLQVPVFFLGGRIKGHEMFYLPKQDLMLPLDEGWINHIKGRQSGKLGEGAPGSAKDQGIESPRLEFLRNLPLSRKISCDVSTATSPEPYAKELWELYHSPQRQVQLTKQAADAYSGFDLRQTLIDHPKLWKSACEAYICDPTFKQGLDHFYGDKFLIECGREIGLHVKQASLGTLDEHRPRQDTLLPVDRYDGQVRVLHKRAGYQPDIDDATRERLFREGTVYLDKRAEDEVSQAYEDSALESFTNPTCTDLFEVLVKPNSKETVLVVHNPHTNCGATSMVTVCRKSGGSRGWKNVPQDKVFGSPVQDHNAFYDWWKDLSSVDSMEEGATYLALGERGAATTPFRVREKLADGRYRVDFRDYCEGGCRRHVDWGYDNEYSTYDGVIRINTKPGTKLRSVGGELFVPDSFKVLLLEKPRNSEDCCDSGPMDSSEETPLEPASFADLYMHLRSKTSSLKIMSVPRSNGFYLRVDERKPEFHAKQAALTSLICDYGFREDVSKHMLKMAVSKGSAAYLVKLARAPWMTNDSALAPAPPEQSYGEPMGQLPAPTESGYEVQQTVDGLLPNYNPQPYTGEGAEYINRSIQHATQTGQKELFDVSGLSRIAMTADPDAVLERNIGPITSATDKLGKTLLLLYCHEDHFADRFGKEDLPETEDALRNAFEMVGKVVIQLKEKDLDKRLDGLEGPDIADVAAA